MGTSDPDGQNKVTEFVEFTPMTHAGYKPHSDALRTSSYHEDKDGLGTFLSRPIQIGSVAWTPNQVSSLSLILDPWTLFMENKRVANRMNNYFLMGGNLHVKYMVNGNGFYYGRAMVDYVPLSTYDTVSDVATLAIENVVAASQRLHVYVDPTTSQGGELTLPMLWPYDRIGLLASDYANLGRLYLRELAGLKHANGALTPVEITVFAWMTDVELSIPTTANLPNLVPQSREKSSKASEYGEGSISAPLSAAAAVAAAAASVPAIAPLAMATAMVASGLGSLAKSFGFSRPALLPDIRPVRPTCFGVMATTDALDDVHKLTLTSKQEISIDPRTAGAEAEDEMVVADIAAVESWLTYFPWSVSRIQDDCLFSIRCTPTCARVTSSVYYLPAMCFAAAPFTYWKGTLRVRMSIVASAHHKGRLRVIYDPNYIASTEANVAFNRVIDLERERDVTIDVPWSQRKQFLPCRGIGSSGWTNYQNSAYTAARSDCNGVLGVYVLNTLTSPNSTVNNDISVQVFVSMEDMEVASPDMNNCSTLVPLYNYTPQSTEMSEVPIVDQDCTTCMVEEAPTVDKYKIYFGERVSSFRQVLKRYFLHSVVDTSATAPIRGYTSVVTTDFPQYRGYSAANMNVTATAGKYNYTLPNILHWVVPAYLGVRGGIRSKYHLVTSAGTTTPTTMAVSRARAPATFAVTVAAIDVTTPSKLAASLGVNGVLKRAHMGSAVTDPRIQPVLEVELPYYKPVRFDLAKIVDGTSTNDFNPGYAAHAVELVTAGIAPSYIERYVSIAEDFQLLYFQGCPPLRVLADPAA